ncbi:MAG: helix-turn-helix transcriptional regulator [Bryobacterales bacterium]|nr:helix-turn-helix transcriptional regulator [Bryobacterales bacterium]
MAAQARVLKALAHPTRLFIVDQLSRHEICVCELTDLIGADISTVSKHLSVLRSAGVLTDERRGAQVFYRLRTDAVRPVLAGAREIVQSFAREQVELAKAG